MARKAKQKKRTHMDALATVKVGADKAEVGVNFGEPGVVRVFEWTEPLARDTAVEIDGKAFKVRHSGRVDHLGCLADWIKVVPAG